MRNIDQSHHIPFYIHMPDYESRKMGYKGTLFLIFLDFWRTSIFHLAQRYISFLTQHKERIVHLGGIGGLIIWWSSRFHEYEFRCYWIFLLKGILKIRCYGSAKVVAHKLLMEIDIIYSLFFYSLVNLFMYQIPFTPRLGINDCVYLARASSGFQIETPIYLSTKKYKSNGKGTYGNEGVRGYRKILHI